MILDGVDVGVSEVKAYNDYFIWIISKDGKKEIYFSFNQLNTNFKNMDFNKKISILKYLYWDTTLQTEETYYLFDLTKDEVYLTRLKDNRYRFEVNIENPDMIYCPKGKNERFNSLKIDVEFSFVYDYKPKFKDDRIIESRSIKIDHKKLFEILDKL